MSHDYHEGEDAGPSVLVDIPGRSVKNPITTRVLYDNCAECKLRSENVDVAIVHMDGSSFVHAWDRATIWAQHGKARNISRAELPVLRVLWAIQIQIERLNPTGPLYPGRYWGLRGKQLVEEWETRMEETSG